MAPTQHGAPEPMSLAELFGPGLGLRGALALGLVVAMLAALVVTPRAMRKLRGAGIVGRDRHKPGEPEVPEMGGLAVFIAFNLGVFAVLALGGVSAPAQVLLLASLIVAAGACITGVIDDLVALRQRFKAFIPLAFAAPLALFAPTSYVAFPLVGPVELGLLYPLVLVPLAITCASNGFNMLEGYNGLGAGVGIVIAAALSVLAIHQGTLTGLVLLFPLIGALGGFLWFNAYPARVFPGDTMTLLTGAVLASGAILSKVEFWGALLFVPHILEFFLKARGHFKAQNFARIVDAQQEPPVLTYEGPTESLTHLVLSRRRMTERGVALAFWGLETVLALAVIGAALATRAW